MENCLDSLLKNRNDVFWNRENNATIRIEPPRQRIFGMKDNWEVEVLRLAFVCVDFLILISVIKQSSNYTQENKKIDLFLQQQKELWTAPNVWAEQSEFGSKKSHSWLLWTVIACFHYHQGFSSNQSISGPFVQPKNASEANQKWEPFQLFSNAFLTTFGMINLSSFTALRLWFRHINK